MLKIQKQHEPTSLKAYKLQHGPASHYEGFRNLRIEGEPRPFDQLRAQLLDEVGYVCAYCGMRLQDKPENENGVALMKVEHFIPQRGDAGDTSSDLQYQNLLACCLGGQDSKGETHCDSAKGEKPLVAIQNPSISVGWTRTLRYRVNHQKEEVLMLSSDNAIDDELNRVLNLNAQTLRYRRYAAWKRMTSKIGKDPWPKSQLITTIQEFPIDRIGARHVEFVHFLHNYLSEKIAKSN